MFIWCTITSKINGTPKVFYLLILKGHAILAVANLLAHGNVTLSYYVQLNSQLRVNTFGGTIYFAGDGTYVHCSLVLPDVASFFAGLFRPSISLSSGEVLPSDLPPNLGPEHTGHFVQPQVAAHCGGDIYSRRKPLFSSFGEHTAVCGSSVRQAVTRPRHRQSVCIRNIHVAATCRPSVLGSATMRGHMWLNKVASVLRPLNFARRPLSQAASPRGCPRFWLSYFIVIFTIVNGGLMASSLLLCCLGDLIIPGTNSVSTTYFKWGYLVLLFS